MGVHANGTGSGWAETSPDIDQPHGLDYIELQDIRKGVRKRMAHQHTTFADATVGGIHIPGKISVLRLDTTANLANYLTDPSCAEFGLGCDTANGKLFYVNDATTEWVKIPFQSGSFCQGGDWTWTGSHQFDGSLNGFGECEFTNTQIDGTLTVLDSAEFSDIGIKGDFSCDGTADFAGAVAIVGDLSLNAGLIVDGTVKFAGTVDITGTLNVGLSFLADSSGYCYITGGILVQWGDLSHNGSGGADFTYHISFPNAAWRLFAIADWSVTSVPLLGCYSIGNVDGFGIYYETATDMSLAHWIAIGN